MLSSTGIGSEAKTETLGFMSLKRRSIVHPSLPRRHVQVVAVDILANHIAGII